MIDDLSSYEHGSYDIASAGSLCNLETVYIYKMASSETIRPPLFQPKIKGKSQA